MLPPLLLKPLPALEVFPLTVPAVAQTSSFVVEVPLVTAVPPKAGVVRLPLTAVTCAILHLEHVALPATSPLTDSVVLPMARSALTLDSETAVLLVAGVVPTPIVALDARRALATAL
jgi:hypothetical protein